MSMLDQAAARRIVERLGEVSRGGRLGKLYWNSSELQGSIEWLEPEYRLGQIGLEGTFTARDLRKIADAMDGGR